MAEINLNGLAHNYVPKGNVWALKEMDHTWSNGGAYALLGPSGCGKTTLLNLISGLLKPSKGKILFNGTDVTHLSTEQRNIAQVFQFPVVYDTMSVYDNLAFPLRNRQVPASKIDAKVREIASMLEIEGDLSTKAAGLRLDMKQKISLGRGLVRDDVNAILFDEPLTVIDPQLKWELRYKLKQLHQQLDFTMIYVTHDQTEALTFADKIVVMFDGKVVQTGSPTELFETPSHTFVGKFIGSPGINLLPCSIKDGAPYLDENRVKLNHSYPGSSSQTKLELGVRPEYIRFADEGLPVTIKSVNDLGNIYLITADLNGHELKIVLPSGVAVPTRDAKVEFDPERTQIYADDWMLKGD